MSALPIATNLYFDKPLPPSRRVSCCRTSSIRRRRHVLVTCSARASPRASTTGQPASRHEPLHAADDGAEAPQDASDSMRYGAYAMEVLINSSSRWAPRERFEAKVFGGAAVLAA